MQHHFRNIHTQIIQNTYNQYKTMQNIYTNNTNTYKHCKNNTHIVHTTYKPLTKIKNNNNKAYTHFKIYEEFAHVKQLQK